MKPSIAVANDSAIAARITPAQSAIVTGFSPTARTLVSSAWRRPTARPSSSGGDTANSANTSAEPRPPRIAQSVNNRLPCSTAA